MLLKKCSAECRALLLLNIDLPSMKKEDINVDVKNNVVSISGERKIKEEVEGEGYYRVESGYGKFERSFTLPENFIDYIIL